MTPGCGTPQAKAYQAEGVTINTVDTAMKVWRDRVIAGQATQTQIDAVKGAYETYFHAQLIAKAALEKWIASNDPGDQAAAATASAAVADAVKSVVTIINQYTNMKL